jgi:chromosome segregation ATPase
VTADSGDAQRRCRRGKENRRGNDNATARTPLQNDSAAVADNQEAQSRTPATTKDTSDILNCRKMGLRRHSKLRVTNQIGFLKRGSPWKLYDRDIMKKCLHRHNTAKQQEIDRLTDTHAELESESRQQARQLNKTRRDRERMILQLDKQEAVIQDLQGRLDMSQRQFETKKKEFEPD